MKRNQLGIEIYNTKNAHNKYEFYNLIYHDYYLFFNIQYYIRVINIYVYGIRIKKTYSRRILQKIS